MSAINEYFPTIDNQTDTTTYSINSDAGQTTKERNDKNIKQYSITECIKETTFRILKRKLCA
eukprot:jgi/Psemu1/34379/gm1.34379_g